MSSLMRISGASSQRHQHQGKRRHAVSHLAGAPLDNKEAVLPHSARLLGVGERCPSVRALKVNVVPVVCVVVTHPC